MPTSPTVAASPDTQRRPAVYFRVSTDQQDLERQQQQLRHVERDFPGVEPLRFEDEGVSAFHHQITERPGGKALTDAIASGQVAAVYADAQDRLTRGEALEWLTFQALCVTQETRIVIDGRELTSDDAGQLMGVFAALTARRESKEKQHRAKSSIRHRRERGYWTVGKAPTGYDTAAASDGSGHRTLVPNDDAERVREAFERVAKGESIHKTAAALGFNAKTLSGLLRKPFRKVLRCAECDAVLIPHEGGSGLLRYKCPQGSSHVAHPAELIELEALVFLNVAHTILGHALAGEEWRNLLADDQEVAQLARDLAEIEQQAEALAGQVALGGIVGEKAQARAAHINNRHAELAERHQQATQQADTLRADLERLQESLTLLDADSADKLIRQWNRTPVSRKRDALEALYSKVAVSSDALTFSFRYGLTRPVTVSTEGLEKHRAALREIGLGRPPKEGDEPDGSSVSGIKSAEGAYPRGARGWCADRAERPAGAFRG